MLWEPGVGVRRRRRREAQDFPQPTQEPELGTWWQFQRLADPGASVSPGSGVSAWLRDQLPLPSNGMMAVPAWLGHREAYGEIVPRNVCPISAPAGLPPGSAQLREESGVQVGWWSLEPWEGRVRPWELMGGPCCFC